jgi:adenylate cyclase
MVRGAAAVCRPFAATIRRSRMPFVLVSFDGRRLHAAKAFDGPLELGRRQKESDEPLFTLLPAEVGKRFLISPADDVKYLHRRHVRLEPTTEGVVRVSSLGSQNGIQVGGYEFLQPGESGEFPLPVCLYLRDVCIAVSTEPPEDAYEIAGEAERAGSAADGFSESDTTSYTREVSAFSLGAIARFGPLSAAEVNAFAPLLDTIVDRFTTATKRTEIYSLAARIPRECCGANRGAMLLKDGSQWRVEERYPAAESGEEPWTPNLSVLRVMEQHRSTVNLPIYLRDLRTSAIDDVVYALAAPILDRNNGLRGAVYSERNSATRTGTNAREMLAVRLIATGVAGGLARLEREADAGKSNVLEFFFSKGLVEELQNNPAVMDIHEAEVTLLFADVKAYSAIVEKAAPQAAADWIQAVLTRMAQCVEDHEGTVIDFIGDEVFAVFGAPRAQTDHALRACLAAADILRSRKELNEIWEPIIGHPTDICIGINTGPSRVGNTGTKRQVKFGAVGPHVNLASRVRGATKYFGANLIVTESTQARLGEAFRSRRLGFVRAVNLATDAQLFELLTDPPEGWPNLQERYDRALEHFERGRWTEAVDELEHLRELHGDDGPSLALLARARQKIEEPAADVSQVWVLPGK